jgi:cell division protein FtsL
MSRSGSPSADDGRHPSVFGALAAALPDRVAPRREGEDRTELRVVEPARRRRRNWQVGTVAGLILFVALFLVAGAQALIVQQQGHLDDVNARIETAEQEAARLEIEATELGSPERITREAETTLGMVPAGEPVYLQPRLDDDARAAEVPPTTPPTTAPPVTTTTPAKARQKTTTPTTAASTGTSSGTGSGSSQGATKSTTAPSTGAGSAR